MELACHRGQSCGRASVTDGGGVVVVPPPQAIMRLSSEKGAIAGMVADRAYRSLYGIAACIILNSAITKT
jgi:hypothetical protein